MARSSDSESGLRNAEDITASDAASGDSDQQAMGAVNLADARDDDRTSDERDARPTPVPLARTLKQAVGGSFDVDPCSGCEPMPIGETRYTAADDGLAHDSPWFGSVFVNPPYSDIEPWAEKAVRSTEQGSASFVTMLIPSYTVSSGWFHEHGTRAKFLSVLDGRLTFHGADSGAPFASFIVVFAESETDVPQSLLTVLDQEGELWGAEEIEQKAKQVGFQEFVADGKGTNVDVEEGKQVTAEHPKEPPLAGLSVGDLLSISYDEDAIGFPGDVDANVTVRVLSGRERDGRQEVLALSPDLEWSEGEQYHLLSFDPAEPYNIRAAVELNSWSHLPLNSVVPVASGSRSRAVQQS